jgi:hypothetical protein
MFETGEIHLARQWAELDGATVRESPKCERRAVGRVRIPGHAHEKDASIGSDHGRTDQRPASSVSFEVGQLSPA